MGGDTAMTGQDRQSTESSRRSPVRSARAVPGQWLGRLNNRGFRLVQVADVCALAAVLVGSMLIYRGWPWPTYPTPLYVVSFLVVLGIFAGSLYFGGLYEREPRLGHPPVLPRAARQTLAAGGLVALMNLVFTGIAATAGADTERVLPIPTPILLVLIGAGAVAVAANRRLSTWMRANREGPSRVMLVGAPDDINVAMSHLETDHARAVVVASASNTRNLLQRVQDEGVTEVLLLASGWLDSLYPEALAALDRRGVSVLQRVTAKETMYGLEHVRQIGGLPFVLLRRHAIAVSRARFKRFTDLVVIAVLSPLLLLVLGLVASYQLVVTGRPILFVQDRVGTGGSIFRMVKFRTMYLNAEEDGSPKLATQDDPRIIPACKWLRSTRLDELPQLWNILRGEMSLVGPRPERPELTARFEEIIPGYARRHELPPGLTGLAQIHGRYHTDPEYKLGYDLQYLVNWSPVLDLEILARTIWVVLSRKI